MLTSYQLHQYEQSLVKYASNYKIHFQENGFVNIICKFLFVLPQWVKCFSVPAFDMKLVHVFLPTEIEQTLLKELFVNIWFWLIVGPVFHPLFGLVMHYDMCVS